MQGGVLPGGRIGDRLFERKFLAPVLGRPNASIGADLVEAPEDLEGIGALLQVWGVARSASVVRG